MPYIYIDEFANLHYVVGWFVPFIHHRTRCCWIIDHWHLCFFFLWIVGRDMHGSWYRPTSVIPSIVLN